VRLKVRSVAIVEAKAEFSALLAAVEAGEEIAITRHGRVVARLVPDRSPMAAELFRPFWEEGDIDLEAPEDRPPEPAPQVD
jgi:prevent-host-death family protein